jgi:hypothetical protein
VLWHLPAAWAQNGPAADLAPAKASYLVGEPIELRLTVSNPTNESISLEVTYPFQGGISLSRVRNAAVETPGEAPATSAEVGWSTTGFPLQPIEAGQSWSMKVYAQRYMQAPPAGASQLEYAVTVRFRGKGQTRGTVTSRGRILVKVAPGTEAELSAALAAIWAPYEASTDYGERLAVEQAMSVADTPLAIPYLAKLVKFGLSDFPVIALGKFRGDRDAEEVLLSTLSGKRSENAPAALSVLGGWDYVLPEDAFSRVLTNAAQPGQLAALDYAKKINNLAYLPAVSACAKGGDPYLANQAAEVRDELAAKGSWRLARGN